MDKMYVYGVNCSVHLKIHLLHHKHDKTNSNRSEYVKYTRVEDRAPAFLTFVNETDWRPPCPPPPPTHYTWLGNVMFLHHHMHVIWRHLPQTVWMSSGHSGAFQVPSMNKELDKEKAPVPPRGSEVKICRSGKKINKNKSINDCKTSQTFLSLWCCVCLRYNRHRQTTVWPGGYMQTVKLFNQHAKSKFKTKKGVIK